MRFCLVVVVVLAAGCSRVGFEPTERLGDDDVRSGDPTGDTAAGDSVAPGDEAPGDPAPGDVAVPGDAAPGDVSPGDSAGGDSLALHSPTIIPGVRDPSLDEPGELVFSWVPEPGATSYEVTYGTSPDCPGTESQLVTGTDVTLGANDGLLPDTTYYWCVRALADSGAGPWSSPRRVGTYAWRMRVLDSEPLVAVEYASSSAVPWQGGNRLVHPAVSFAGPLIRDLGWQFDLVSTRWRLVPLAPGDAAFTGTSLTDFACDDARDVSYGLSVGEHGMGGTPGMILGRFDAGAATWSEVNLTDDTSLTECSGGSLVYDANRDLLVVFLLWCIDENEVRVVEIDVTSDPATTTVVSTTGAPQGEQPRALLDPRSGLILVYDSATYLYDTSTASWTLSAATRTPELVVGTADALLGFDAGELLRYQDDDWTVVPATGVPTSFNWFDDWSVALTPAGDPGALWFGTTALGEKNAISSAVIEPGDRPVLTLTDSITGSPDGSDSPTVDVTVTDDIDADAWLVSETATPPLANNLGWQNQRPATATFSNGDGLRTLYLWLRYPNGEVSTHPAIGSIWLWSLPPAPTGFILRDPSVAGAAGDGVTTGYCINAVLTGDTTGLIRILASTSSTPPLATDFDGQTTFPTATVCGQPPGSVTVYGWGLDAAGHIISLGSVDGTFIDVTPPNLSLTAEYRDRQVSAGETITWLATDPSEPITYDYRLSSAPGCAGDVASGDGLSDASFALPPGLIPGTDYWLCVRAIDGWLPANVSDFRESQLRYQATSSRWYPLAPMPIADGYSTGTAYDISRGRLMVFGGFNGSYHRDVYAYESATNSWSGPLATSGTQPPGRGMAHAFYDEPRDRMVIYGGFDFTTGTLVYPLDTYALDLATNVWSNVSTTGEPGGRRGFAVALDASGLWVVSPASSGEGNRTRTYLFDPLANAWTEATGALGMSSFSGTVLEGWGDTWSLTSSRLYSYDPLADSGLELRTITGQSIDTRYAVLDPYSGAIVSYLHNCVETAVQTRRTYLVDTVTGHRTLSDAGNIPDRCEAGLALDRVRRSVLLIAGYTESSPAFTRTNVVHEFRINGGPRVFASDTVTGDESVVSGSSVDLAIDWDEAATAWLVNETDWPPPPAGDGGWLGTRPTNYVFPDGTLGDRTIYVWTKDGDAVVVEDAGRWTVTRQ